MTDDTDDLTEELIVALKYAEGTTAKLVATGSGERATVTDRNAGTGTAPSEEATSQKPSSIPYRFRRG